MSLMQEHLIGGGVYFILIGQKEAKSEWSKSAFTRDWTHSLMIQKGEVLTIRSNAHSQITIGSNTWLVPTQYRKRTIYDN